MAPPPDPSCKPLLTVAEAAALAGVPRSTFYRLIRAGLAPGALVQLPGCRLLVRRRVLEAWLAAEGTPATAPAAPAARLRAV